MDDYFLTQKCDIGGKTMYPGRGNKGAKIMFVTSYPTFEDLSAHYILGGNSQIELRNALTNCGLSEESVWITSVVKHSLGAAPKPSAKILEENRKYIEAEIAVIKPKLIVAFGDEPWKFMLGKPWKSSDFKGEIIDGQYGKMMYCYSPFMIFGVDPTLRQVFNDHIMYAKLFVNDEIKYDDFQHVIITDPEENKKILQGYIDQGKFTIGYDAEWLPLKDNFEERMFTFQYSMEPHKAILLDICPDGHHENLELLNSMKLMLEHPKVDRMGWNIRSDDKVLIKRGFNLADETLGFDGMKAVQFFSNHFPKGLETGIKRWTDYEPYYVEFYMALKKHKLEPKNLIFLKFLEPELYNKYCAGDAVSHYTACKAMRKQMIETLPSKVTNYYFNTFLPLSNYLLDMEMHGIPINVEEMEKQTQQYQEVFDVLYAKMIKYAEEFGIKEFKPFYFASLRKLYIDKLQLKPGFYKYKKKPKCREWFKFQKLNVQKKCTPSTDNKSLLTMYWDVRHLIEDKANNAEVKKYLEKVLDILKTQTDLNRINAILNKCLSKKGVVDPDDDSEFADETDEEETLKASYWAAMSKDKRIHTSFFECKNNFRCGSTPNTQNAMNKVFPAIKKIFKTMYKDQPEKAEIHSVRNCFYPGHPDWLWLSADVSGADLAIMANLSGDDLFIKHMRSGNFHLEKAKGYWRKPDLDKDKDADLYTLGKNITFRCSYSSSLKSAAMPIQADIYAESGTWLSIKALEDALESWNDYKKYIQFREACLNEVREEGTITMRRGMKFYFERTDNQGIQSAWLNESLAFPVAGELALFMHDVAVSLRKYFKGQKEWGKWIYPVNYIHDDHNFIIHKDLMKDNYVQSAIKKIFCEDTKMVTGDTLGVEMTISDCCKGKTIWEKKTKYDFDNSKWVLNL